MSDTDHKCHQAGRIAYLHIGRDHISSHCPEVWYTGGSPCSFNIIRFAILIQLRSFLLLPDLLGQLVKPVHRHTPFLFKKVFIRCRILSILQLE